MTNFQFISSSDSGETLIGKVFDNNNNGVDIYTVHGRFEFLMAITQNGIPLATVARHISSIVFSWEENSIRDMGLLDLVCVMANDKKIGESFNYKDKSMKVTNFFGDALFILNKIDNSVIVCVAIKSDGEVVNFWIDADYRKSCSLDTYLDIVYGLALDREWIGKGLTSLFSLTAVDNFPSIRYQMKIGCKLQGYIYGSCKWGVYRHSVKTRIDRAKKAMLAEGMEMKLWK